MWEKALLTGAAFIAFMAALAGCVILAQMAIHGHDKKKDEADGF